MTPESSRRSFLRTAAAAGAFSLSALPVIGQTPRKFRIGLIGCGGRGTGAVANHLEAAKRLGIEITVAALADPQAGNAKGLAKQYNVPDEKVFDGFDAYHKLLATDIDIVLIATPPNFRPIHVEAAVKAGKHIFAEKPVGVDPPGIRRFIAAGEAAVTKGLTIVAGTQRRHSAGYVRNARAIQEGAIGKIAGGIISWCQGQLWFKRREQGESDAMYLARNWVNFTEMSGDHIVEQHVHNIDVANWFIGRTPIAASGFGGRARRVTGNQYDFFSVDYDYGEDLHIHSMCRQINGTKGGVGSGVGEFLRGTDGTVQGGGKLVSNSGKALPAAPEGWAEDGQVQEHVALLQSLVEGKPLNESRNVAESTMTAVMGRIAAYTGSVVRWAELMTVADSKFYNLTLSPSAEDFEKGDVKCPQEETAAIPGQ